LKQGGWQLQASQGKKVHETSPQQEKLVQALVVHICNSIYLGGRDQEDCSSKTAWADSL
jgi:hypothetical protein